MDTSILKVIQHYQKSIERSQDDGERLLHCIHKLYKLPVKVEHLQETGIGKTVNSLRKYDGEIGVAAKALVTKWKAMVAAEEEPTEPNCPPLTAPDYESNHIPHGAQGSSEDDRYEQNCNSSEQEASPTNKKQAHNRDRHGKRDHKDSVDKGDRHSSRNHPEKEKKSSEHSQRGSSKHKMSLNHQHPERTEIEKSHKHHREEKKEIEHSHKKETDHNREKERGRSEKRKNHERGDGKHNEEGETKTPHSTSHHKSSTSVSESSSKNMKNGSKDEHRHNLSHKNSSKEELALKKESKHEDKVQHSSSKHKGKRHSSSGGGGDSENTKDDKLDQDKPSSSKRKDHKEHKNKGSSNSHLSHSTSSVGPKRPHNSDNDSGDMGSPKAKIPKESSKGVKRKSRDELEDGIDSSMGANFADVLGMLNMPTKKSKKSLGSLKPPTTGVNDVCASSSSTKENSHKSSSVSKLSNNKLSSKSSSAPSTSTSTKKPTDEKPALLTSAAKLEPLDPSIVMDLPPPPTTISTNYKPLPLNQTVMECVFSNYSGSNSASTSRAPVRTLTDAEALSHGISSKTMRTKIYSGIKTGQIHQVPSLFDLCIRILQKNIDALEYTGGVPFEVLRPVLERATPQQLLIFEDYNPYLMDDSDVLWQLHVQRNYRNKKRQEMESWREMYLRCQEEEAYRLNTLTESIKQSQKIIAAPVRKTQLAFVDSMVKPPRNVMRKQEQFGTMGKLVATPASRVAALSSVTPNAAKVGDTRLRVAPHARDTAQVSHASARPKKAPLMAKTLQFMRGRQKR